MKLALFQPCLLPCAVPGLVFDSSFVGHEMNASLADTERSGS